MNLGGAKVKAGLCSTLYTGHGRELAGKACVHYGRGTNLVDYWEGIFSPDNDVVHVRLTTFASEVLQCFVDTTLRCSVGNRQKRAEKSTVMSPKGLYSARMSRNVRSTASKQCLC